MHFRFDYNARYKTTNGEDEQASLSLEDMVNLLTVGKPSLMQKAVFLCKLHRGWTPQRLQTGSTSKVRHEGKILNRDMPYGKVLAVSRQKELRQENLMVSIRFMRGLAQSIVRMQEKIEWMKNEYGDEAIKNTFE
ncbi:hypothetical protein [Candidatus Nitrosotalea okcheonensis]|uniref:Uncharacterized protein n=1 Tax=Candidatus Nitrosotalea okcheonensis TaxID=1903276 RepID=A0A2H1FEI9_9ARCH|nr:hypothetical protein [Candidatus Nitrosotalea okcheonensis]SMH71161.1 protein of unknown function [Candidatus Nitrosotalea okcheonensis]